MFTDDGYFTKTRIFMLPGENGSRNFPIRLNMHGPENCFIRGFSRIESSNAILNHNVDWILFQFRGLVLRIFEAIS